MRRAAALALLAASVAAAADAPQPPPAAVAPFTSVTLSSGGWVEIRYGPAQAVTVVEGDPRRAALRTEDGRLYIGRCRPDCPPHQRLHIEIVTPGLDGVAVHNGGTIVLEPGFPVQPALTAAVDSGGRLDARGIAADHVAARIAQGGAIFTRPMRTLDASVRQGGIVTFWGRPTVRRAVQGGGVIARGEAADERRPLSEIAGGPEAIEPPKPVPPVPPLPKS